MRDADGSTAVDRTEDQLGAFFRRVESRNPFLDNRINGPSANDVDVDAIHRTAFDRLTRLAREALDGRRGVGVVLWGEAGVGKSHLLSRLGRWANEDNRACCIYLHNLQAAPEHLPRSLLHAVVNILTRNRDRRFAGTPLFDMIHASLLDAVDHKLGKYPWTRLASAYSRMIEGIAGRDLPGATLLDRTVWDVLFRFYRSASRASRDKEKGEIAALGVRWLAGQALDPDEAKTLELPTPRRADEPAALLDNQQIKQVLVTLTRLAASQRRPFLLVFDQVDNLDAEQAAALGCFLEAAIDSSPNLLVVTTGVKDTLYNWVETGVIHKSTWDRVAQIEITLQRVQPAEAARIVEARLRDFLEPFADVELVSERRRGDALFPLGESWRERFFQDRAEIRPRDAVNWAREGWRQQQESLGRHEPLDWLRNWPKDGDPGSGCPDDPTTEQIREAIDRKITDSLVSIGERLASDPCDMPLDADRLAEVIRSLLVQCRDSGHRHGVWEVERVPPPKQGRPTYHLSLRQRDHATAADKRTGVLFLLEQAPTSVAAYLRRLLEDRNLFDRVIVVTEERIGLPLGQTGREYLDDLNQHGPQRFQTLELNFAERAELEALQIVFNQARERDLEIEPRSGQARAVAEQEVIDAYHRHGRYLASRLLRALLKENESEVVALLSPSLDGERGASAP